MHPMTRAQDLLPLNWGPTARVAGTQTFLISPVNLRTPFPCILLGPPLYIGISCEEIVQSSVDRD
jgi:hypothetical protein